MLQDFKYGNYEDANGNPAGGFASGTGFSITWQNGPLVDPETGERKPPSGAFVETIIQVVIEQINYYQQSQFACEENANALASLEEALQQLQARTARREAAGVEGTHQGN